MFNIRRINDTISVGVLDLKAFSVERAVSQKRELETNGTYFLLNKMLDAATKDLNYDANSKPYLKGREEHISISHSHDKLAIIINQKSNTGIDIELIRDKVKGIQHKFLNRDELSMANDDSETLISFWAIKETLYKIYGLKEVDFIEHLFITSYSTNIITGRISIKGLEKNYKLAKEKIENYIMIYALDEI